MNKEISKAGASKVASLGLEIGESTKAATFQLPTSLVNDLRDVAAAASREAGCQVTQTALVVAALQRYLGEAKETLAS